MVRALGDVRDVIAGVLDDIGAISTSPAVMAELLGDLKRAESVLAAKLRAQVTKHGGALDDRFGGAQAVAVHGQVQLAISAIQKMVTGRTAKQAANAIRAGVARTVTTMEGLEKRFTGIVTPLRLREAAELSRVSNQAKGMWARQFPTSVDRYGDKMLGDLEDIMRAGILAGSSMDDIIGALTGHGGPRGKVSLAAVITPNGVLRVREADIPEGLFVRNKYWAERLVRTEMLKAYNGARQAALESAHGDHPGMKRKILATLDKRTGHDSIAVHGQVRGIKENFVDGAGRSYLYPPARPNDRETVIPWKDEWDDSAQHMSEWEKVCIGEGDAEMEERLFKTMEAIAKGQTRRSKSKGEREIAPSGKASPPKPAAVKTPMEQPKVQTWNERLEADYKSRLSYRSGSMYFDGMEVGKLHAVDGRYKAHALVRGGGGETVGEYDTETEARDAMIAYWNKRASAAAGKVQRWKLSDYETAARRGDYPRMRALARGLLHENGVTPRDAILSNFADEMYISPKSQMPEALAVHHWDGKIGLREDTYHQARTDMQEHLRVVVHEELHGSTAYTSSGFYARHGAAIEEVSVEMAARKVSAKAMGKEPNYNYGSYQPAVEEVFRIISQEVVKVDRHHSSATDRGVLADVGIKMRGDKARKVSWPDEILDQFVRGLRVPEEARARIRQRIAVEVRLR